jgi:hypothetical protein
MIVAAVVYGVAIWKVGSLELDLRAYLSAAGSSALMGIIVFAALSTIHSFLLRLAALPILVVLGAVVYLLCLRLLQLLTTSDLRFAQGIVPPRFHRILLETGKLLVVKQKR